MRAALFAATILWLALAGPSARAGQAEQGEQAVWEALKKPIRVAIKDRFFEEAVKDVCALAGLKCSPPLVQAAGHSGHRSGNGPITGVNSGRLAIQTRDGRLSFSITTSEPLPAETILRKLCTEEGWALSAGEGMVLIVSAAEVPFDPRAYATDLLHRPVPPEPSWQSAISRIVRANDDEFSGKNEYKPRSIGDDNPTRLSRRTACAALLGHPQRDAIRVWLLCNAATAIWCEYWRPHSQNHDLQAMNKIALGQVVAAIREAQEILAGDPKTLEPGARELNALLKKLGEKQEAWWAPLTTGHNSHDPLDATRFALAEGLFCAASACQSLNDLEQAVSCAKKAAQLSWKVSWSFTTYYGFYHTLVTAKDGAQATQLAAQEDLKAATARFAEMETLAKSRPAGWRCPDCGMPAPASENLHHSLGHFQALAAKAELAAGRAEQAVALAQKAIELGATYDECWTAMQPTLSLGPSLREQGGFDRRLALAFLLSAWEKAGQQEKAQAYLLDLRKKSPADTGILTHLGRFYRRRGEKAKERATWGELLELDPEHSEARMAMNLLDGKLRPVADKPVDRKSNALLGQVRSLLMDAERIARLEQVQAKDGKAFGDYLATQGTSTEKYALAMAKIREGLAAEPAQLELLSSGIKCLRALKALDEAKSFEERLAKADPKAIANLRSGDLKDRLRDLVVAGKREEALALVREALAQQQDAGYWRIEEIRILQDLARYEEAFQVFTAHQQEITPDYRRLVEQVRVLWGVGRKDEARKLLDELKSRDQAGEFDTRRGSFIRRNEFVISLIGTLEQQLARAPKKAAAAPPPPPPKAATPDNAAKPPAPTAPAAPPTPPAPPGSGPKPPPVLPPNEEF